ncbi:family 20 glycosylhydrolase [Acetobacter sp. LMG 1627]|uniref:beta-N-acetylhexosaminidase n=2 Tax=Acetobacter conturbans TaxID=1737472 RepID=A0ABX0K2N1_9PROT|nr:family 20 glycosylhydrolase [Acetobacter conturbans]
MPVPQSTSPVDGTATPCGRMLPVWESGASPLLKQAYNRFHERLRVLAGGNAGRGSCSLVMSTRQDKDWLSLDQKENYRLTITGDKVRLEADGPAGILHAFATLLQLARTTPDGVVFPDIRISDSPRFRWRGLMIDVSRHFMSIPALHRQIDAMELTKLNVLHLHLNDGAAFRVESHVFPQLQAVSAHGQYYTQAQIRELVRYAADRGIRVVPEFDVPGHALAILEAYPDLAAEPLPSANAACTGSSACIAGGNANNPALDPTNPNTLIFVEKLFAEMGTLFPDKYFHAGGDEVVASQWTRNPRIMAAMKDGGYADSSALQGAFTARVQAFLAGQGKTVIGWDEVLSAPVPKNVVAEVWRASKWIGTATQAGHPVIVSSGYYLDLLRPAREHYQVDPYDVKATGLFGEELDYAHSTHFRLADAFALDPGMSPLTGTQENLVLGGEAALWTEVVSKPMLDQRLWPRAAVLAERFWSPASVRDISDMERRLPLVEQRLETLALQTKQDHRAMVARFGTSSTEAINSLLDVTSPVRNYTINRMAKKAGDAILSWPIAIATPDSFSALRFNSLADAYVHGDGSGKAELEKSLKGWVDNAARFQKESQNIPALEMVRPISEQLSHLAQAGLDALEGKEDETHLTAARILLKQQEQALAASSWQLLPPPLPQPPGGLLIDILPGIRALVERESAPNGKNP